MLYACSFLSDCFHRGLQFTYATLNMIHIMAKRMSRKVARQKSIESITELEGILSLINALPRFLLTRQAAAASVPGLDRYTSALRRIPWPGRPEIDDSEM